MNEAISDMALDLGEWKLEQEYEQLNLKFPDSDVSKVQEASVPITGTTGSGRNYPASNLSVRRQKGGRERTDTKVHMARRSVRRLTI